MSNDNLVVKISLVLLLLFSFYILWPFVSVILFSMILAYFTYPAYKKMEGKVGSGISAGSLCVAVAAVIIVMVTEGAKVLIAELSKLYKRLPELIGDLEALEGIEIMGFKLIEEGMEMAINRALAYITGLGAVIPHLFFSVLIFFIGYFYFLTKGHKAYEYVKNNLPLEKDNKKRVLEKVKLNVDAFIRAEIAIAVAQGIVAGFIFYVFGHPYPFFVAIVTGILALIPVVGPSLVYWPVGIYEIFKQNYLLAVGYIVSGMFVISMMDYVLRPRIMGKKAKVHPFVVLLGFLGGIYAFGPGGIIIGPVILSLALILVDELKFEDEEN